MRRKVPQKCLISDKYVRRVFDKYHDTESANKKIRLDLYNVGVQIHKLAIKILGEEKNSEAIRCLSIWVKDYNYGSPETFCACKFNELIDYFNTIDPPPPPPPPPPTPWQPHPPSNGDRRRPVGGGAIPLPIIRIHGVGEWIGYDSPDLYKPFRRAACLPEKTKSA